MGFFVHRYAIDVEPAHLDHAEAALTAFDESEDPSPLEQYLGELRHEMIRAARTRTALPSMEAWQRVAEVVTSVGASIGARREVVTASFEAAERSATRHQRLVELQGPAIIIENEKEILADVIAGLEDTTVPERVAYGSLDRIGDGDGDMLDLLQVGEEIIRYLGGIATDVRRETLDVDAARFQALDDFWVIHRYHVFENDFTARHIAPELMPPAATPFLDLEPRTSRTCRRWREQVPSILAGRHGGPIHRDGGRLEFVWVETEELDDPFR